MIQYDPKLLFPSPHHRARWKGYLGAKLPTAFAWFTRGSRTRGAMFFSWSGGSWLMWYDVMRRQIHPQVIQVMLEHDLVLKPVVTSGISIFFLETSKWLTTTRAKWIKAVGGWSWIHVYRDELISTTGMCAFRNISARFSRDGYGWMNLLQKKHVFDPGAYDDETWGLAL